MAQVFLTNQTPVTYKLLSNLAGQSSPVKTVNDLSIKEIEGFMKEQFDPKRFVIRERFKFWSNMQRKPGETVQELAARIRHDAGTCDFPSIKDPLDEALRTRFICSIGNEAVLKAIFKINADELTFTRAIEVAMQTEDAAKVVKETVYGTRGSVHKVRDAKKGFNTSTPTIDKFRKNTTCYRCGKPDHLAPDCRYKRATCKFCKRIGHLEIVCRKKQASVLPVQHVNSLLSMKPEADISPKLEVTVNINGKACLLEIDTATSGNFISVNFWKKIGKPSLKETNQRFNSATEHLVPILGAFEAKVKHMTTTCSLTMFVTEMPHLNLLGRCGIEALRISLDKLLCRTDNRVNVLSDASNQADAPLQHACKPVGEDADFDREESAHDTDTVCAITSLSLQVQPTDSALLRKESGKDPTLSKVMRFTREGWPSTIAYNDPVAKFRKVMDSLSTSYGCLLYGSRLVIPDSLRSAVLQILHQGHFGIQRMKQLARTAFYWPNIDDDITVLCHKCQTCAEHQNAPPKAPVHPWMMPEKPWSRLHIDHAVNFLGSNWLVMIDAHSKYPCIHQTQSMSSRTTMELLEQDFAHFGYPHTIVSDNAQAFMSAEFQDFCKQRGIVHLTGAPYFPATNGAAERLVQTFKKALKKSSKPPKEALQEFLLQYRRIPNASGFSPSELLNGRQIRAKIDTLLPSPAHLMQRKQVQATRKPVNITSFNIGDPCYALYLGPRRTEDARWVPATIIKRCGSRTFHVKVLPRGPIWRRHIDQLRARYASDEDLEPGAEESIPQAPTAGADSDMPLNRSSPSFGPDNPRRTKRSRKPPERFHF
uniref:Gypsy retrotransposon integrase-like protein 1 n=1 Tax=Phallusia mammillata TaxID=59560 RepID=A0A6F9DI83_9ASCI|nr:uncharacterized protein LOC104265771 [Phallusia mammillata]